MIVNIIDKLGFLLNIWDNFKSKVKPTYSEICTGTFVAYKPTVKVSHILDADWYWQFLYKNLAVYLK